MKTQIPAIIEGTYYPFIVGGGTFTWTRKGFMIRIQYEGTKGTVEAVKQFGTATVVHQTFHFWNFSKDSESKRRAISKALAYVEGAR